MVCIPVYTGHGGSMLQFLKKLFWPDRHFDCFGRTDTGKVRRNNEDNFAIQLEKKIFVVADGMGGHKAGEVASRMATESLVEFFSDDVLRQIHKNPLAIQHNFMRSFHEANRSVMETASGDPELQGMGCTLIACLVDDNAAYVCHVGDVRGYLAHSGRLDQVTSDHSLVSEQTVAVYSAGAGMGRNVITRGIGFPFPEEPEFHRLPLRSGNKILLCSDGLWGMVDDEEIHRVLEEAGSPEKACDELVHLANEAGGKDNITAVVLFY